MIRPRIKYIEKVHYKLHTPKGHVDIGVFGAQGSQRVIIAASNEFGTEDGRIPERSFLRSAYNEEKEKMFDRINKSKLDIVLGKISAKTILERIGLYMQSQVRKKINTSPSWAEKNADSTLKKKFPITKPLFAGEDRIKKDITYKVKT